GAIRSAAVAIHLLALLYRHRHDGKRAQELLDASPVAGEVAIASAARAQWLHYNGLLRADCGELNTAQRFFFRAHQDYKECPNNSGLAEVCDSVANLLIRRGKARIALTFARQSLDLRQGFGDRYGAAISHGTAGRALVMLTRFDEAVEEFQHDLAIAREIGDIRGVGIMLNAMGEVELTRGNLEKASAYYCEAQSIEAGPAHQVHTHLGLAWVKLLSGNLDAAAEECDQAAGILETVPQLTGLSEILIGLRGAIAWRQG